MRKRAGRPSALPAASASLTEDGGRSSQPERTGTLHGLPDVSRNNPPSDQRSPLSSSTLFDDAGIVHVSATATTWVWLNRRW